MSLPSSGPLSMSAIATELSVATNTSLRTMSDMVGFTTPDKISDFYGFNGTQYTVTIQAKAQASFGSAAGFWYKKGLGGTWTRLSLTTVGTTYASKGTITVYANTNLYLGVRNTSVQDVTFGTGNGGGYSGYCGESIPYIINVTSTQSAYLNLAISGGQLITC